MPYLILVADDEPVVRRGLVDLLTDAGYRVAEARDGQAALDLVDAEAPDLVLSDVMMPRMDGLELVRRLRARGVAAPVVLVSVTGAAVDLPGVRLVPKPFDLDHLLAEIERSLGGTA